MKTTHFIVTKIEGTFDELLEDGPPEAPNIPSLQEVLDVLQKLAFIAETVAHLHKLERTILPVTHEARDMIKAFNPGE